MPVLCLAALAAATLSHPFDHSAWDRVLKAHVNAAGEVDYAAIQRDRRDPDPYIAQIGRISPANHPELFPSRAARLAYWINACNAFVTRGVVDHYPTRSVRDLGVLSGFFWRNYYTAGGASYLTPERQHFLAALKNPSVAFFDYDWAINDPGSRMRSANPLEREAARP